MASFISSNFIHRFEMSSDKAAGTDERTDSMTTCTIYNVSPVFQARV